MMHRKVVHLFSTLLIAALAYGCDDNTPTTAPSAGLLEVDPLFVGVDQGSTTTLTASLNGDDVPVTWESSDPAIATVSSDGEVTGVTPGMTAITAHLVSDPTQQRSASISVLELLGIRLTSGVPVTNISSGTLERNEGLIYHITVPAGATSLTVTLSGGSGDGDIYVQRAVPSDDPDNFGNEDPGCHSWNGGNGESCTVAAPEAGTWYVFVAVWDPYAGATLTATVTP
jgi:hypothetical protein